MKNIKLITLTLFFLITGVSCNKNGMCIRGRGALESREIALADFDGIHLLGSGKVTIVQSDQQKVIVRTRPNLFPYLNTNVNAGIWDIKFDRCVNNSDIEVEIFLPNLTLAEIKGSGEISSNTAFASNSLDVVIEGSGKISLVADVHDIKSIIAGSGDIYLSGTADNADMKIEGSGKINAYGLATKNTKASVTGSGKIETSVSNDLNVRISGSGDVFYKGNPIVNSQISGSGKVESRN